MKPKSIILTAAACIMVLSGCKDDKPKYGAPMNVNVFGVTGRSNLDPDLKLGLFVGDPVGVDNVAMTVSSGGMAVPEKDIKWAFDQSRSSRFLAYAPYDVSFTGQESVTVSVPADQSTAEKMLEGNLLLGITSGGPKETAVNIKLQHAMTAMTVTIDNRSGSKIESLSVSGFMGTGQLNLITGNLKATDDKQAITPMRSPYDENSFCFIYIPQDVTPYFNVTLASGKKILFTYDNYCHEYPGCIIRMKLQIDESTPEVNLLELSGVSLSQWIQNGVPLFAEAPSYTNLAGLKDIVPDEEGFFSAYLNKVTVTAVDRTSDDILGVILEDSTCAIHAWTNENSPLEVGNTIVGPVLGMMDEPSEGEIHISYLHVEFATVGKTDSLPCTQGTFGSLADNIGKMEYRRMVFKDAVLEELFDNDRAVFVQDGVRMSVICPDVESNMALGCKGDLIGFPIRTGADITIITYDENQFELFGKDVPDNALTRESVPGLYNLSNPETAVYVMNGPDAELQYSVRKSGGDHLMQVSDTRNKEVFVFAVLGLEGSPLIGHEYMMEPVVFGNSGYEVSDMNMECVKVDGDRAWLVDDSGEYGLILAL